MTRKEQDTFRKFLSVNKTTLKDYQFYYNCLTCVEMINSVIAYNGEIIKMYEKHDFLTDTEKAKCLRIITKDDYIKKYIDKYLDGDFTLMVKLIVQQLDDIFEIKKGVIRDDEYISYNSIIYKDELSNYALKDLCGEQLKDRTESLRN